MDEFMDKLDIFDPAYLVMLDEIYHAGWVAEKRHRMALMASAVARLWPHGHPTRLIQISGTSGKGTVAHKLSQALALVGRTGSWTGPHVFDYVERFHVNGSVVDRGVLVELYQTLVEPLQRERAACGPWHALSFAELGILLALCLFERERVDWAVMEVGAGGRYTPLMALPMEACILTNIGFDHPKRLGEHGWQRALEKAGMARPGIPFFSSCDETIQPAIKRIVEAEHGVFFPLSADEIGRVRAHLGSDVPGFHLTNQALTAKVVRHFHPHLELSGILNALEGELPGRFSSPEPGILLDVAHNHDKMAALSQRLMHRFPGQTFVFVVGLTRQRRPLDVFSPILPLARALIVTSASYPGQDPREIAAQFAAAGISVMVEPEPKNAVTRARALRRQDEWVVVSGSAYMIDQAFNPDPFVACLNRDYGWRGRNDGHHESVSVPSPAPTQNKFP